MRAWTIQKGTKAPQAAGKIHNDFENGFIMAEVMAYDDYKELGSENACKVCGCVCVVPPLSLTLSHSHTLTRRQAGGKYRQQGRGYTVLDGDIIFFKFNTGGLKKK